MKKVVIFANSIGNNSSAIDFASKLDNNTSVYVVGIGETLPKYASIPSHSRADRIESILKEAGQAAVDSVCEQLKSHGAKDVTTEIISGRFPNDFIDWCKKNNIDLIVKEPIPVNDSKEQSSKGDVKLSRHCSLPLLLANQIRPSDKDVMVGVAPDNDDIDATSPWIHLIDKAAAWAKSMNGNLHVVHSWEVWAENPLRSKMPSDQLHDLVASQKEQAESRLKSICDYAEKLESTEVISHLVKGDPTRALVNAASSINPALIVLGNVARVGIQGYLLGNTAESFIKSNQFSVLIEPLSDFETST